MVNQTADETNSVDVAKMKRDGSLAAVALSKSGEPRLAVVDVPKMIR